MKKKIAAILMALVCGLSLFTGCGPELPALATPERVRVNEDVLMWQAVENASGYVITVNGEEYTTEDSFFDLSFLENGIECVIEVRALGDGENFIDSEIVPISCTITGKPAEPATQALTFTILADGSGYEVSRKNENHEGLKGRVVIPDTHNGLPVKKIAAYGFGTSMDFNIFTGQSYSKNEITTSIRLPSTLEEIGAYAFEDCLALERVEFPKSLRRIGESAFENCIKMETLSLSKGVEEIGINAFKNTGLKSVRFPESVKVIDDYAFSGCGDLETIQLSSSLEYIGSNVFNGTAWYEANKDQDVVMLGNLLYNYNGDIDGELMDAMLPEGTKYIGANAFALEKTITSVTLTNVEVIGKGAFTYCTELRSVSIAKMKTMPDQLFNYCDQLEEVTLPDGLENIGQKAFAYCRGLQEIRIPSTVKTIELMAFNNCDSLVEVTLPEGVECIETEVFYACDGLIKVNLPKTLKKICMNAFGYCPNLTDVILPASLEKISNILNKKQQINLYYEGTAEQFASNVDVFIDYGFTEGFYNATLYYYAETNPGEGNYWHYDTDNKTPIPW